MRYSIWNQATRSFDYFESGEQQTRANAAAPAHLKQRTLGSTIEQAAWPLPTDATAIGSGPMPIGRIAVAPGAAALGDVTGDLPVVKGILLAAAGFLGLKYLMPKRGRR